MVIMPKSKENSKYISYHKHYHLGNTFWPTKKGSINCYQQVFLIHSFHLGLKKE
jgi:hypothetical protein